MRVGYIFWGSLLSLCLLSPALWLGLQLDDYFHWSLVTGQSIVPMASDQGGIFGLFSFMDGDPERTRQLMDVGMVPWWTLDTVRYAFWRPVSELTHGIDYGLLISYPWLMHVHGLIYFVALLYVVAKLFEDIQGEAMSTAGRWAFWIFALAYSHGVPAAWLANRNAVLATLFVVLTLRAHHRWRQEKSLGVLGVGLLCFVLGLLSGELAVSAGLYLFSYALFIDRGSLLQRGLSLVPYGALGVVWLLLRSSMEYGAKHSGHYIDPSYDVWLFLQVVGERAITLLAANFFALPPELLSALPAGPKLMVQGVLLIMLSLVIVPLLVTDRRARFWLLGLLLCVLPVCATIPHSRLLMCVSIGGAGLLGLLFARWRQDWVQGNKRWLALPTIGILLGAQFVVSPLLLPLEAASIRLAMDGSLNDGARNLPVTDAVETVVILNPPMSSVAGYINGVRAFEGKPVVKHTLPLVSGRLGVVIKVIDDHTLEMASDAGLYDAHNEGLLRDPYQGFAVGDRVELHSVTVTVLSVSEAQVPTAARFRFNAPIVNGDNRTQQLYLWANGNPALCEFTGVGQTLSVTLASTRCDL